MIQIKKTKSVEMEGDKNSIWVNVKGIGMEIPAKYVWQVIRGLVSFEQRFYRKHEKISK
jgi:hypothetical protein